MNFNDASTFPTNVPIAVGGSIRREATFHSSLDTFPHIKRLLLRKKSRHIGECSTHHPPGWSIVGGLRDGNERKAEIGFNPFKLDIVKEISCGPIYLVKEACRRVPMRVPWPLQALP